MERKHKIIIISLVIVIVALAAGLSYMLLGNGFSGEESVPDGMQRYDFDSRFTMLVPDDARFLKEYNTSSESVFDQQISFLDKHNKFAVAYIDSPLVTNELFDFFIEVGNSSGNASFEFDGDFVISHNLKNSGKVGKNYVESEFKYTIATQKGHEMISVQGNDLDLIKSMAHSIKFYGDGD